MAVRKEGSKRFSEERTDRETLIILQVFNVEREEIVRMVAKIL